ncbi:hypothetical protein [Halobacillus yeomjeoni]|uniref:Uncharacterized protein n=1 Tax=Halobacillus yeomjeoni TaxID=311194 RepID=A0A931HVJ5_9BACI|nr:hypothetical protein [Halobacillus yeomjeoni]MBH0229916.1 hypothetical protein [Halobacillus yeomjeoni]
MGELFDLIFSNFLIVAAIIGGIISWFRGMSKEREAEQPNRRPSPPTPSASSTPEREERPVERSIGDAMQSGRDRINDYYEEKRKRLEEVSDRENGIGSSAEDTFSYETPNKPIHTSSHSKNKKQTKSLKKPTDELEMIDFKQLNKKRLREGIIMSEVLGSPRAYRPHQSHPRKR